MERLPNSNPVCRSLVYSSHHNYRDVHVLGGPNFNPSVSNHEMIRSYEWLIIILVAMFMAGWSSIVEVFL